MIKKYKKFRLKAKDMDESQSDLKNDTSDLNDDNVLVTKKEQDNYDKEMHNLKDNLKSCKKNKDGKIYDSLCGSRDNVYYEKSYKTSGVLIKEDLIHLKSVSETIYKRFEKCGVNTLNT